MPTRIAFGSMALTSVYNPEADLRQVDAALDLGLELGIRWIHTAEHYGNGAALRLVGSALRRRPDCDEIGIIAKIDAATARLVSGPEGVMSTCQHLGRSRIDMVQLVDWSPWSKGETSTEQILHDLSTQQSLFDKLCDLRDCGRIGRVGIGVSDPTQAALAATIPLIDFLVCDQSVMRRVIFRGELPDRVAKGIVEVVATRPLAGGWLTARYRTLDDFHAHDNRREWYSNGQALRPVIAEAFTRHGLGWIEGAMRFLHQFHYPQLIAVGMRTPDQVREIMRPEFASALPDEVYRDLAGLFRQPVILEP